MGMKITFTLSSRQCGMKWSTNSLLADGSDMCIDTDAASVPNNIMDLYEKYNKQGISVLFDVE